MQQLSPCWTPVDKENLAALERDQLRVADLERANATLAGVVNLWHLWWQRIVEHNQHTPWCDISNPLLAQAGPVNLLSQQLDPDGNAHPLPLAGAGLVAVPSFSLDKLTQLENGLASQFAACDDVDLKVNELYATIHEMRRTERRNNIDSFSTLTNDLAEVKVQLDSLSCHVREFDSAGGKVERLQAKLDGFAAEVARLQASHPADLPRLLDSQSHAILGAVGSMDGKLGERIDVVEASVVKVEDRLDALVARNCTVEANRVPVPSNVSGGDGPIAKPCRFFPNCRFGSTCRFQHIEREGAPPESEVEPEEMQRIENMKCEGCGFLPWYGCASSCPSLSTCVEGERPPPADVGTAANDEENNGDYQGASRGLPTSAPEIKEDKLVHGFELGADVESQYQSTVI